MPMNPKENCLEVINWGKPEYVPMTNEAYHFCRMATGMADQPWTGGTDPFGINWVATPEGAIPEPNKFLFDDIADWRKHVVFPDPNKMDFESCAKIDLETADRSARLINVLNVAGLFERLVAFMGFENALCSFLENPEDCTDFFYAMAQYKIKCLNRVIDTYKPDVITYFDDMATARGLFMSLETYRTLIKPYHKMIVEAVTSRGVVFTQHMCGKCEDILEDLVEIGVKIWSSAQVMNDLNRVKVNFYKRLIIEGGWDSSGPCSYNNASVEMAITEAMRCIEEYRLGGGYIMMLTLMNENGNSLRVGDHRLTEILRIWPEISKY